MPAISLKSDYAIIEKSPSTGNLATFSTNKAQERILCKEMLSSQIRRQVSPYSKIYNDETRIVLGTFNVLAKELQTDDAVKWKDYKYSVQTITCNATPIGNYFYIELK